jgi:hypothetical protein
MMKTGLFVFESILKLTGIGERMAAYLFALIKFTQRLA